MSAFIGSAVAAAAIGYLLATSYLVLRDDLIGAAIARQARIQHAYEDRISALRAQVDRITSRQMLDQKLMENRVAELLTRQSQLTERHGRLAPILDRARKGDTPAGAPVPAARPGDRASLTPPSREATSYASAAPFSFWSTRNEVSESNADRADKLFVAINQSLRTIEDEQLTNIASLADDAYMSAEAITDALEDAGLPVDTSDSAISAMGGPLLAVGAAGNFEAKVKELDLALATLDRAKEQARRLPIANPAPGKAISSTFGVRRDPLLGTPAMHAGMDFRAPTGSDVRAAGPGKVIRAGWNGGYGRMVEIDHGNGLTTRYAHMSRITVKEGEMVETGTPVGKVGSSGRSTGPHLHYEVRREGEAINPLGFIKVGRKLAQFL
jgi:murein DD-endopeptidase MepM/ murein hydrolase activator NlpD